MAVTFPRLLLSIVTCISAVFGLVFNAYILLVLVYTRQIRTANNILLLHLAVVDIVHCLETLSMITPSAINDHFSSSDGGSVVAEENIGGSLCQVHGFLWTVLLPVAVWTLCGLNCDRYAAISSPLHYSRLVRSKRIVVFLALTWLIGVALALPPFFTFNSYSYRADHATCMADFTDRTSGLWYPVIYTTVSVIVPASLILFCNLRILTIARHHQHRIVSAIYEVTLRAQATITHQRNPFYLTKYKGKSAILTIVQLVGSLLTVYGPQCGVMIWEIATGRAGSACTVGFATAMITCSPLVNGLVYGVKSRALRKTFKNFLRRHLYTSEVNHEIQRRGSVVHHNSWSMIVHRLQKGASKSQCQCSRLYQHRDHLPTMLTGHEGSKTQLSLTILGLALCPVVDDIKQEPEDVLKQPTSISPSSPQNGDDYNKNESRDSGQPVIVSPSEVTRLELDQQSFLEQPNHDRSQTIISEHFRKSHSEDDQHVSHDHKMTNERIVLPGKFQTYADTNDQNANRCITQWSSCRSQLEQLPVISKDSQPEKNVFPLFGVRGSI